MKRCEDCDRDMEEDHQGVARCFSCRPPGAQVPIAYRVDPELAMGAQRHNDTREGLKRPVKP